MILVGDGGPFHIDPSIFLYSCFLLEKMSICPEDSSSLICFLFPSAFITFPFTYNVASHSERSYDVRRPVKFQEME